MAASLLMPSLQSANNRNGVYSDHIQYSSSMVSKEASGCVENGNVRHEQEVTASRTQQIIQSPIPKSSFDEKQTAAASTTEKERRKKKPYKELTLEEKVELIRMAEENSGMSQASIAEKYAIAKSNVCRILQRKQEYLRAFESAGFAGSRKRKLRREPDMQHSPTSVVSTSSAPSAPSIPQPAPPPPQPPPQPPPPSLPHPTPRIVSVTGLRIPTYALPPPIYCDASTPRLSAFENKLKAQNWSSSDIIDDSYGNETLRAHMYKQHQISRMFMCRCCNWAFPDKTSLHMHMQAKEEGKNISVPVIGKGNPPPQIVPGAHTNQLLSSTISQQATTLHAPQPRPAANTSQTQFASLPLNSFNSLPAQQQLTITDPNVLQAAAVSLFPHLALLRGDTSTNTQNEDFMAKLQHRLMLNNLVAQSGFGLAAWLASLPKNDQSGEPHDNSQLCSGLNISLSSIIISV